MVCGRANALLRREPRIPPRTDRRCYRAPRRSEDTDNTRERGERNRGTVPPRGTLSRIGFDQRSGPAPAVATASSGWMSTASTSPAKQATPATMRDTTGVAPSVNGTSSPASA
jgi:hypothetical protein